MDNLRKGGTKGKRENRRGKFSLSLSDIFASVPREESRSLINRCLKITLPVRQFVGLSFHPSIKTVSLLSPYRS